MVRERVVQIVLNGEQVETAAETLAAVLAERDLADAVVATAVNGDFVPARSRSDLAIRPGDRIEIVAPMQGG
jgi:sulfur carrier protein